MPLQGQTSHPVPGTKCPDHAGKEIVMPCRPTRSISSVKSPDFFHVITVIATYLYYIMTVLYCFCILKLPVLECELLTGRKRNCSSGCLHGTAVGLWTLNKC